MEGEVEEEMVDGVEDVEEKEEEVLEEEEIKDWLNVI
jgi:hypothetical protein